MAFAERCGVFSADAGRLIADGITIDQRIVTPGSRLRISPTVLSPLRSSSSRPNTSLEAVDWRR